MISNFFKRHGGGPGHENNFPADQENGTAIDDALPPPYDVAVAELAEKREKDMTFNEARKADKRLIWYSLGFSGTIIMEGYGLALITYLFSFAVFKRRYGEVVAVESRTADDPAGEYDVRRVR